MKDRTLLFSALIALAIHGFLLFVNLGMTEPSLASVESTIEVTLVGPPETPSVEEPAAEPTPPPEPEKVEVVEPPPEPEPEPVIETPPEPEPAPELEPPEEIETPTKPPPAKLVEETQYIAHPVESTSTGKPSESPQPAKPEMSQPAGGAVAPIDVEPAYMYNPKPPYPRAARRLGQEGRIMLLVEVRASGRVGKVEIETSSGYDILDNAAVKAVRKWRFSPARLGRRPVSAWVKIPVEFDLRTAE